MRSRLIAVVMTVGGVCCTTSVAEALDKEGYCRDYTTAAISAARQNIRLKCGFGGTRYSLSRQLHYGWCMSVGREAAAQERDIRRDQMRACSR